MAFLERNANRGSVSTKYRIDNSVKLEHDNAESLYKDQVQGTQTTWTFSTWLKRTALSDSNHSYHHVWAAGSSSSDNGTKFYFRGDSSYPENRIFFYIDNGGGQYLHGATSQSFRDTSAWYHIVWAVDTTQSTASDRSKVYINGELQTLVGVSGAAFTNPPQNSSTRVNDNGGVMYVGAQNQNGGNRFRGYLAETVLIDGSQLDVTDFGEVDSDTGIWIPKDVSELSFGTRGFYLDYSDASNLGNDADGSTEFTESNISAADQALDTPTNNFCTLEGHAHVGNQYGRYVQRNKEGNTQADEPTGSFGGLFGSHSFTSGKWYWEIKQYYTNSVNLQDFGVTTMKNTCSQEDGTSGFHVSEPANGNYPNATAGIYPQAGGTTSYAHGTSSSANDNLGAAANGKIFQIAFDADNGKIWFGANDTWQKTISGTSVTKANIAAGANARYDDLNDYKEGPWIPCFGMYNANQGHHMDVNFGGYTAATPSSGNSDQNGYGNFEYEPPSGFLAVCSENLATTGGTSTIDDPSAHFQVETYTGGGSNSTVTFSGNSDLQSDFLWIKRRNAGYGHNLFDTTRGIAKLLESNNNNTENTNQTWISAVGSDSFTIGVNEHNLSNTGGTYVAWAWKANGGSNSNNTDGGYTVSLQANTDAGFSIGTYTGSGGNSPTATNVGHGLGIAPEFVIIRARNRTENWSVYHSASGTGGFKLDDNTAHNNNSVLGDALATATVVDLGTDLRMNGGYNYVMYSWAAIAGYSTFGKYEGNGFHNTAGTYPVGKDGPFVHTGFRPALIFIKRDDAAGSWTVYDHKRDGYNNANDAVFWNSDAAESSSNISGSNIDIFSNGFKIKSNDNTVNSAGATYTYGAWAASPQQTSTTFPGTGR